MDKKLIIEKMSIEEKARLLVGKDAWHMMGYDKYNIPSLGMTDGPHGLRKTFGDDFASEQTVKAVCYPSLVTLASTFNPEMAYNMGKGIGSEFKAENMQLMLGPGINIKRNPLGGRNFEYFSEDPLVTIKMAGEFIKGAKSENVGVCLKHYALNSQESYRMVSDSLADDRAKYEIYYKTFRELVKLEPEMIMCSYNKVDGVSASENIQLLKKTLRDEFGFNGVIVSDWTAVKDRTKSLFASLDLEMPGYVLGIHKLIKDYNKGLIPLEIIDESVERLLNLIDKFKDFKPEPVNLDENHLIAKEIAEEAFVLLKNNDDVLPIKESDDILLIGEMAEFVRYQGGGSSHINSYKVDNIKDNLNMDYVKGYLVNPLENDDVLLQEAIQKAKGKDKVIIVCGLTPEFESEGFDREHLSIPTNQLRLIEEVSKVNNNIILILEIGSPIKMPFIDKVKGILNAYLGGEALGIAIKDVLYGKVNPSGRLAETFPVDENSICNKDWFAKGNNEVHYKESIFVGYRYYETFNVPVLFPFGYGLSYTKFKYDNLQLSKSKIQSNKAKVIVSVDVTNIDDKAGKEVVQLYFNTQNPRIPRPKRELLNYTKIYLEPNETKTVTFEVTSADLAFFNPTIHEFMTNDGIYNLQICKNAHEVILEKSLEVSRNILETNNIWSILESYSPENELRFTDEDFSKLLGKPLDENHVINKRPYDINNNLEDIERTLIGKLLIKMILRKINKELVNLPEDFKLMLMKNFKHWPIRSLVLSGGGKISMHTLTFVLELINMRYIKALKALFSKD